MAAKRDCLKITPLCPLLLVVLDALLSLLVFIIELLKMVWLATEPALDRFNELELELLAELE